MVQAMASAPELFAQPAAAAIRVMVPADVPQVVAIERAAYQFPWSEGIFRDCLRVGYVCRVLVAGADVVGYGVMSVAAGEAHVLNLCIAEARRCRGAGRQLLRSLLSCAAEAGAAEAFLEVRPSNTTAIRLYLALGFEQVGMRRGYYQAVNGREDAAVLKLALGPGGAAAGVP
jgi:[ribosomal protein S18]-alanine N-acetyltransferase